MMSVIVGWLSWKVSLKIFPPTIAIHSTTVCMLSMQTLKICRAGTTTAPPHTKGWTLQKQNDAKVVWKAIQYGADVNRADLMKFRIAAAIKAACHPANCCSITTMAQFMANGDPRKISLHCPLFIGSGADVNAWRVIVLLEVTTHVCSPKRSGSSKNAGAAGCHGRRKVQF